MTGLDRLQAVCGSSAHWELECRHTDAGDPWCITYDRHEQIVLPIARIDRRYLVVWPTLHRLVTMPTIDRAIDMALTELVSTT
jgi:hypothetical protein